MVVDSAWFKPIAIIDVFRCANRNHIVKWSSALLLVDCWSSMQRVGILQPQQRSGNLQQHQRHPLGKLKVGQVVDKDLAMVIEVSTTGSSVSLPFLQHTLAAMVPATSAFISLPCYRLQ